MTFNIDNIIKETENNCNYEGCKKKIKLTDFPCKCKQYYCKIHKFPNLHNCNYDYKEIFKKKLKIEELKCSSIKLEKI
tara:strand:+ start:765 stop:998 length:234 start_codon:yes stop_codon:yes gene_type:complete